MDLDHPSFKDNHVPLENGRGSVSQALHGARSTLHLYPLDAAPTSLGRATKPLPLGEAECNRSSPSSPWPHQALSHSSPSLLRHRTTMTSPEPATLPPMVGITSADSASTGDYPRSWVSSSPPSLCFSPSHFMLIYMVCYYACGCRFMCKLSMFAWDV